MCDSEYKANLKMFVLSDFRETFQETVEFDAGINFFPNVDPFDGNTYIMIPYSTNDSEYVGKSFGGIVWKYWDENVDDYYYPEPYDLLDALMDYYFYPWVDCTNAMLDDFVEEVYSTAYSIIDKEYRKVLNDFYREVYG